MERFDGTGIESMLRELRPTPRPEFVAELDDRAATGFQAPDADPSPIERLAERLRAVSPRRALAPAAALSLTAIAVTAGILASSPNGGPSTAFEPLTGVTRTAPRGHASKAPAAEDSSAARLAEPTSGIAHSAAGIQLSSGVLRATHRDIERSATIALLADSDDVADDSAQVFATVHDANGIVLRSNTTQGPAGKAGATFDLLIPSARLGDALAAISVIDEVGSRHDATVDITAPTVAVAERLRDSRARIDSLLAQLASVETESEREALEAELRSERQRAAALEAQLSHLDRRTHYSHVSVRIESGDSPASSGGTWGFDDALGSAGHVLGVAAGVTLVGLAVLAPIAILALLAWLAHRTWLRIRREHALSRRV